MSFRPDAQLDASQVSRGSRRPGGTIAVGGGAGVLVLVVGVLLFGPDFALQQLTGGGQLETGTVGEDEDLGQKCRTGEDANADVECRVVGTVNSLNAYWANAGARDLGVDYRAPQAVLTSVTWETACWIGTAA